jgi:hypothetical protein
VAGAGGRGDRGDFGDVLTLEGGGRRQGGCRRHAAAAGGSLTRRWCSGALPAVGRGGTGLSRREDA